VTLPAGFTSTPGLLVNDGPTDAAAGRFAGELTAPALWSRQVLTDDRLRALTVTAPVPAGGPEAFQAVHATAERVAADLGIGAVEVAVWWADTISQQAVRQTGTWTASGFAAADLALVVTDAAVPAGTLASALADWPGNVVALSSGLAPADAAEFAAAVAALRLDLGCVA
jgi:hypothetical protein